MSVELITSVLVAATATPPAGAYDLTDLATAKDELNLLSTDTSKDSFLSRGITQVSSAIANYCNRVFPVELVEDQAYIQQDPYPWQVPGGVFALQLSRWPLVDTPSAFTGNTHGTTTVDGLTSAITSKLTTGEPVFDASGNWLGTIATINAGTSIVLTLGPGVTAPAAATGASFTAGICPVQTLGVGQTQALVYGTDYTIDAKKGWLIRLSPFTGVAVKWESYPTTIIYRGGYATIPADLQDACLRLITARSKARARDPMLMEQNTEGQGTQRFWVGTAPGQDGALPPEIAALCDNYRVPVVV